MRAGWRQPLRGVRPGLTLIELLVAILGVGLMGALLLPRLAPAPGPASAPPAVSGTDGACLPADDSPVYPGDWQNGMPRAYVGIGAVLDVEPTMDGWVRIHQPFEGSPAAAAGIEPGDVVQDVDGVSVRNECVGQVAETIREGQIGTPVHLTISREGYDQPIDVTVTRQCIHPPYPFDRSSE